MDRTADCTALIHHPTFLEHDAGPGHPECPRRLEAILEAVETQRQNLRGLVSLTPSPAPVGAITAVHSPEHVAAVESWSQSGTQVAMTMDTLISPRTFEAAMLAAGGAIHGVDEVMAGRASRAFCAHRPPGHHAEYDQCMGFCYFNHVAIAARHLQREHGLERVAIVDWDVHHGNGTQHAFDEDESVFFFSVHEYPLFPGTGSRAEEGSGAGRGYTKNVPLPAGQDDARYERVFKEELRPAIDAYRPQFILISAGFDAHLRDPLGGMHLTEHGYERLTETVVELARDHCEGRLVSLLEGGYDHQATAASVVVHLQTLMG